MNQNLSFQSRVRKVCVAGVLLAGLLVPAARGASGESQEWLQFWASANITDTVGFKVTREDRFRDTADEKHYYGYTEISAPIKLNDRWSFAPALRAIQTLRGGEWVDDLMPHINLVHKAGIGPLTLKNRMRLAKINKESAADDPVEYQHRADLILTKGWTSWNIRPYVAEELFLDFDEKEITRSRASGGLLVAPVKKLSLDLYVMREDTKSGGLWNDILVLGLATGYEF